jgi:hypothetical protein
MMRIFAVFLLSVILQHKTITEGGKFIDDKRVFFAIGQRSDFTFSCLDFLSNEKFYHAKWEIFHSKKYILRENEANFHQTNLSERFHRLSQQEQQLLHMMIRSDIISV